MSDTMSTISRQYTFDLFLKESEAYSNLDILEHYLEQGQHLGHLPMQPLYTLFKDLPIEKIAEYLPKLTKEQRKTFLDLDLWYKDELDIKTFGRWLSVYDQCQDEKVQAEFAQSPEFSLYLKGIFNIWTFDAEDPEYPDHDYYFLTEDNLLLFEYKDDFEYLSETKNLIKVLYSKLGVENAYAHLFKIVSEAYMEFQEDEYRLKKEWLRDYGFVDYYDALALDAPFASMDVLKAFLMRKVRYAAKIDSLGPQQTLHRSALIAYKSEMDELLGEINKIKSEEHRQFLNFNFLRLVNGTLTLSDAIREGSVAMTRTGKNTRSRLKLGLSYLKHLQRNQPQALPLAAEECLFEYFDFQDLYKIGNTLTKLVQKDIKRQLNRDFPESNQESFLGPYWTDFLDNSFDWPVKFGKRTEPTLEINSYEVWSAWKKKADQLIKLLPFAQRFFEMFSDLKNDGKILSEFYLNYTIDDIDFEAILLSSFANFSMGLFNQTSGSKMGLTIDELRNFTNWILDSEGKVSSTDAVMEKIVDFQTNFGLNDIEHFSEYLLDLLRSHLEGYDYNSLSFDDFKHVGGPILLTKLVH
jgi:hypothetical protein